MKKEELPSKEYIACNTLIHQTQQSNYIAIRICSYRNASGLTQRQLAELCGVNESTIRNYELGNRNPNRKMIGEIAEALAISPYAFIVQEIPDQAAAKFAVMELEKFGLEIVEIEGQKYLDISSLEMS